MFLGAGVVYACQCDDLEPRHEFIGGDFLPEGAAPAVWVAQGLCVEGATDIEADFAEGITYTVSSTIDGDTISRCARLDSAKEQSAG